MSLHGIKKYNLHSLCEYDIFGLLLKVEFCFYTTDKIVVQPSLLFIEEYYMERENSINKEKIWVQAFPFWNPHSTITADSVEDAICIFEEYLLYKLGMNKNFSKENFAKINDRWL